MLQLNRKQMDAIGTAHLQSALARFIRRHVPSLADAPAAQLDADIAALLRESRAHGLRSQRSVAVYALANCLLGRERVGGDATVRGILAARERPLAHRSLLLQIWLVQAWGQLQRSAGARP